MDLYVNVNVNAMLIKRSFYIFILAPLDPGDRHSRGTRYRGQKGRGRSEVFEEGQPVSSLPARGYGGAL